MILNVSSVVGDGDLTARAVIRNVALRLFADHGPDAVTVRMIATEAGVSAPLVLHHFGSKAGLREAVDAYAAAHLDALTSAHTEQDAAAVFAVGSAGSMAELFGSVFPPDSPLPAYLRRLLLAADPAATTVISKWLEESRRLLEQMTETGMARQSSDPQVRAAFLLCADLALLLLREPLTAALGFDPMTPPGLTRWAAEVAAVTRDGIFLATPTENPPQP